MGKKLDYNKEDYLKLIGECEMLLYTSQIEKLIESRFLKYKNDNPGFIFDLLGYLEESYEQRFGTKLQATAMDIELFRDKYAFKEFQDYERPQLTFLHLLLIQLLHKHPITKYRRRKTYTQEATTSEDISQDDELIPRTFKSDLSKAQLQKIYTLLVGKGYIQCTKEDFIIAFTNQPRKGINKIEWKWQYKKEEKYSKPLFAILLSICEADFFEPSTIGNAYYKIVDVFSATPVFSYNSIKTAFSNYKKSLDRKPKRKNKNLTLIDDLITKIESIKDPSSKDSSL